MRKRLLELSNFRDDRLITRMHEVAVFFSLLTVVVGLHMYPDYLYSAGVSRVVATVLVYITLSYSSVTVAPLIGLGGTGIGLSTLMFSVYLYFFPVGSSSFSSLLSMSAGIVGFLTLCLILMEEYGSISYPAFLNRIGLGLVLLMACVLFYVFVSIRLLDAVVFLVTIYGFYNLYVGLIQLVVVVYLAAPFGRWTSALAAFCAFVAAVVTIVVGVVQFLDVLSLIN